MKKLFLLLALMVSTNVFPQDVIVKKDGSTILSKVIEVTSNEVKYRKYSNQNGPLYSIERSDILSINYENGEKEEYNITTQHHVEKKNNITLKAGTEIPIQIISPVKAADVKVGQSIPFKVNRDISVDGQTVIPYGTPVRGVVYQAEKSSWWGTKGKLGIRIDNILLPNGGMIPLGNGDVYVTGTNRTALSVLLFLFVTIPACAICGSKAQIPVGYETVANIAVNTDFDQEGRLIEYKPVSKNESSSVSTNEGKVVMHKIDGSTEEGKSKLNGLTLPEAKVLIEKEILQEYGCVGITDVKYDFTKVGKRIKWISIEGKLVCN